MSWRGLADRIVVPALLALLCAAALWRVLAVVGLHVPLDPNEGWNAYHAASAMGAGALSALGFLVAPAAQRLARDVTNILAIALDRGPDLPRANPARRGRRYRRAPGRQAPG